MADGAVKQPRPFKKIGTHVLFNGSVGLRLITAIIMYLFIIPYYASINSSDIVVYHAQGEIIADQIRSGAFSEIDIGIGSPVVGLFFGCIYACFGPHLWIMSIVYLAISIGGVWCWKKAIRARSSGRNPSIAYEAYAMLSPGVALWTVLPGKDGIVFLGLGYLLMTMTKRTLRPGSSAIRSAIGVALVFAFRPHVGLVLMGSMLAAALVRRRPTNIHSAIIQAAGVLAAMVMFVLALPIAMQYANIKDLDVEAVGRRIAESGTANATGGSLMVTVAGTTLTEVLQDLPRGAMMILFEPYPWEVANIAQFLVSLENFVLLGLLILGLKQFAKNMARIRTDYVLAVSLFAAIGLLVILSPLANIGLIARQKIQLLPFLMILLTECPVLTKRGSAGRRQSPIGQEQVRITGHIVQDPVVAP